MVKNEGDIIETFCRYYAQFVDGIIITNHRSVDATPAIIDKLIKEGLPIQMFEHNAVTCDQSSVMTSMMRGAVRKFDADWVLPLDADEFLYTPKSEKIKDVISEKGRDKYLQIPWRTYIPEDNSDKGKGKSILEKIEHRLKEETSPYFKAAIPSNFAARRKYRLSFGNHLLLKGLRKRKLRSYEVPENLLIGHFPVRSREQLASKVFGGWLSQLSSPERSGDQTDHWRRLFRRFLLEKEVLEESVRDLAIGYLNPSHDSRNKVELVYDPIRPQEGSLILKYQEFLQSDPLKILADTAEEIAAEMADLKGRKSGIRAIRRRKG